MEGLVIINSVPSCKVNTRQQPGRNTALTDGFNQATLAGINIAIIIKRNIHYRTENSCQLVTQFFFCVSGMRTEFIPETPTQPRVPVSQIPPQFFCCRCIFTTKKPIIRLLFGVPIIQPPLGRSTRRISCRTARKSGMCSSA